MPDELEVHSRWPEVRKIDFTPTPVEGGVDVESVRSRWGEDVRVKCRGCEIIFSWPHDSRGGKDVPNRHELHFCPNCGKPINYCYVEMLEFNGCYIKPSSNE